MKNKKIVTLIATLGLMTCLYSKVDAVKFYDTFGTRYEGAVERLSELEIVNGVSATIFNAEKTVTRAEFAKMITKALLSEAEFEALLLDDKKCQYKDVSKDDWFYTYVLAASNYGLINGYADNTFKPDKEVSYQEIAKMVLKSLGHDYITEDHPEGWAKEYVQKMYEYKITEGTEVFKVTDPATRGNVAIIIWNMLATNVWDEIFLNDTTGFTYADTGEFLFTQSFSEDYECFRNVTVKDIKEIDGKLAVSFGGSYYKLKDQTATINLSMLGGKATALVHKEKNEKGEVESRVLIGLSVDVGNKLYEGSFKELSEDGFSYAGKTYKIGSNANYGYLLYGENTENVERVVAFNSEGKRFFIDEIDVKEEKPKSEDDDDEKKEEKIIKTITLNENQYVINDGAVVFYNNKRVDWETVKPGDVITEVERDKYYIITRKTVEARIKEYKKKSSVYTFVTDKGQFTTYSTTQFLDYLSDNVKKLNAVSQDDIADMIGKKVELTIDVAEKIVRLEFLDSHSDTVLEDAGLGFFYDMVYANSEKTDESRITLVTDEKQKTYKSTLTSKKVELGDLVAIQFDENDYVSVMKEIESNADLNENAKIKSLTYRNLTDQIEDEIITDSIVMYKATYQYDLDAYEKVVDFQVEKINLAELKKVDGENSKFFIVTDDDGRIKILLVQDFSEKKQIFYGRANVIYKVEETQMMEISAIDGRKKDYKVSGLKDCVEWDFVSFEMLDNETIKILEVYKPEDLGYYKDIIVNNINKDGSVVTNYGILNLQAEEIVLDGKAYNLSNYTYILIRVGKEDNGLWAFVQSSEVEKEKLKLVAKDRIAIDEIENTVIIYRGYSE